MTLQPFAIYSGGAVAIPVLISLLVCLIPTTIGGLLSAIGIAGMDRMIQQNVIAMSGRAVEAAGDVNTLLLDKTGTITLGNRQAVEFVPVPGRHRRTAGRPGAAGLAARRDAGGAQHRGAGQGAVQPPRPHRRRDARTPADDLRAVLGGDPDERRRHGRRAAAQGRRRRDHPLGAGERRRRADGD